MKDFENELDKIRIELYEKTIGLDKEDIIENVNSRAKKIALEFGIKFERTGVEEYFHSVNT